MQRTSPSPYPHTPGQVETHPSACLSTPFIKHTTFSACWVAESPKHVLSSRADPGFLERGFKCIWGGSSLCRYYLIFLKYLMKMK